MRLPIVQLNKERLGVKMKLFLIFLSKSTILYLSNKNSAEIFLSSCTYLTTYYSKTAQLETLSPFQLAHVLSKQYPMITNVSSTPPTYNHTPHISIRPKLASLTLPRLDPMHHSHVPLVIWLHTNRQGWVPHVTVQRVYRPFPSVERRVLVFVDTGSR